MRQFFVLLLLLALAAPASAFPALPAEFSGTVTINGDPAPAGTVVTAKIGDRDCGSLTLATAGVFGGEGNFDERLAVNGEDSDAGETISFFVDGILAGTATYGPGTSTNLALAVTKSETPGGSTGSTPPGPSSSGPSTTPTATVTEPTESSTPVTGDEGAVWQEAPAATAPLTDPTLTFGPVVSATAVQQAGLPLSWLTGLAALAGAAFLVRVRKQG